jgi:cysteine synthase
MCQCVAAGGYAIRAAATIRSGTIGACHTVVTVAVDSGFKYLAGDLYGTP